MKRYISNYLSDNINIYLRDFKKYDFKDCEIYIIGIVYNNDLLINGVNSGKDYNEIASYLEGDFVIVIIEKEQSEVFVITDKINSKKIFYKIENQKIVIHDSLKYFYNENLSKPGLACYLANGNMLNNLTIFEHVYTFERSSIYKINENGITRKQYWDINFDYSEKLNKHHNIDEFRNILKSAIKKRFKYINGKKAFISLSAGYDARSIAALLHDECGAFDYKGFSYSPKEELHSTSDAYLSAQIAEYCDFDFEKCKTYQGDFIPYLLENTIRSQLIANFCDELDCLKSLSKQDYAGHVFVGDEFFGRLDVPLKTDREILDSVSIAGSWGLGFLSEIINKDLDSELKDELDSLTNNILKRAKRYENPHDKKDYLYLDQRVNHVNLTWRQYFTSMLGEVHNPYLDGEILDFMLKQPPENRIEKKLFIETITRMLSEVFKIPIANDRTSLASIDYWKEIKKNRKKIITIINDTESKLDPLISKNEVISAIDYVISEHKSKLKIISIKLNKGFNYLRRKSHFIDKMLNQLFGERIVKKAKSDRILIRLLMIRFYLCGEKELLKYYEK